MTIPEKLSALRAEMKKRDLNAYIVPTDDFHSSEYVGTYFKVREYLSGFTGSAGTLLVLEDSAYLWTDGRYFLQAADQLEGSTITLMKMGNKGVPTLTQFIADTLPEGAKVGFDARVMTAAAAEGLRNATKEKQILFFGKEDLADLIWEDRPSMSARPVWEVDPAITGKTRADKLTSVRAKMAEKKADLMVLTALDEIAWLTNLRGDDVACTPVYLSYMLLEQDRATLFAAPSIFSDAIREHLAADGITLCPYEEVYAQAETLSQGKIVWADEGIVNERLMLTLQGASSIIKTASPIGLMKAVKTSEEQKGMKNAHLKDGIAVTRFICWLQHNVGKETITELSAAEKLFSLRKEQEGFLDNSFDPILAYGAHGAIVHYEPTPETDIPMEAKGLCLADTGGQYMDGTTDITRTIPLGELTAEEKKAYTLVLQGHLNLGAARFIYGASGQNLDYLARIPLWEQGLDYNHGTGHGVGFILGVHEGPHSIHWNFIKRKPVCLEEGMVISNEPGFYETGKFGIRHENLVLVVKDQETEYGQFMKLEPMTLVPFDKSGIDMSLFDEKDCDRLNAYHRLVWDALEPYFEGDERTWLQEATAPLVK